MQPGGRKQVRKMKEKTLFRGSQQRETKVVCASKVKMLDVE